MDLGIVTEVVEFVRGLNLSKPELFGVFVGLVVTWRLPVILQHRREMRAAKDDFALRSEKARAKIADTREKRVRRLTRGK
jgi:hypothetical protein